MKMIAQTMVICFMTRPNLGLSLKKSNTRRPKFMALRMSWFH